MLKGLRAQKKEAATAETVPEGSRPFEESPREAEAKRDIYKQLVDEMPVNVMTCDLEDLKIDYMNQSCVKSLKEIEHHLPVTAEELMGQSIDVFYEGNPQPRQLFADPNNLRHRTQVSVGDEKLNLLVSAIRDDEGNYTGPMLTWSVVTSQVRLANNVKDVVEVVSAAASEMNSTAKTMTSTADATNQQATAVAAASEEASTNVQTVASASAQLASSITEISR